MDPPFHHQHGASNLAEHNFVDINLEEKEQRASPLKPVDMDDVNDEIDDEDMV